MTFDPAVPYNDLPDLPPSRDIETVPVLKRALTAGRALAELKGLGATIPDQGILINSIVLQEAKASSEIENIVTTNDALFRALAIPSSSSVDPTTKEVLRYREALWTGFTDLSKHSLLTTNVFASVVSTIRKSQAGIRALPGTVLHNPTSREIIYSPPEGEDLIRRKLRNLEEYIHSSNGPDPLIKMAAIHYQFEAIHPFSDGNGRNRSHSEHLVSCSAGIAGSARFVSEQVYNREQVRILPSAPHGHTESGLGAVDTLHA